MNEELEQKLNNILRELPSECNYVDYKQIPYKNNEKDRVECIKDIISFLNCNQAYLQDKFIIFGIMDKTFERIGLIQDCPMMDDNEFQELVKRNIEPRPDIYTGRKKFRDIEYGYICIPAINIDRIYLIKKNYPNINPKLFASTTYSRYGSVKDIMDRYEMERIFKQKFSEVKIQDKSNINFENIEYNEIIKQVVLLGKWDENNANDREIISEFVGEEYYSWIKKLRQLLIGKSKFIKFNNNKWEISNRLELLENFAKNFFEEEIDEFKKLIIKILSENNPKFELESDKRVISSVYGMIPKYSTELSRSLAEFLPIIKSIQGKFENCSDVIKYFNLHVIRALMSKSELENWASLSEFMPLFAEADEGEFLRQIEDKINNNFEFLENLAQEDEKWITTKRYIGGIYCGLELIAWYPERLVRVCMILTSFYKFDNDAMQHLKKILLPWYPQTMATSQQRKVAIETIIQEDSDVGWKLLKILFPGESTLFTSSYKPKWNNNIVEINKELTVKEYWEEIKLYIDIALIQSENNIERIIDLIDILDDVNKDIFKDILNKLSLNIRSFKDEEKYILWNKLEDMINRHKNYQHTEWAFSKDMLDEITELSKKIKPNDKISSMRFFRKDRWDLIIGDEEDSVKDEKLNKIQSDSILKIVNENFESIMLFAERVEDAYLVGEILAEINSEKINESMIIECLDSEKESLIFFAQGYCMKKFKKEELLWLKSLEYNNISLEAKINLFKNLPLKYEIWSYIETILKDNENLYWENTTARFFDTQNQNDYALEKLIKNNRASLAIKLIYNNIINKIDYNCEIAIKALKDRVLNNNEPIQQIEEHIISKIINDLQKKEDVSKKDMIDIEWIYIPILGNYHYSKPIFLHQELADNPEFFNKMLSLAYETKEESKKEDIQISTNAYKLLNEWKTVPGLKENNIVDSEKLNKWYEEMKKICTESNRLNFAMNILGKVLFYSIKDKSDLLINKSVVLILNGKDAEDIRRGYSIQAFNSISVHNYDGTGKIWFDLAKEYEEKAEIIQQSKLYRFAECLRDISNDFNDHGNTEIEKNEYK